MTDVEEFEALLRTRVRQWSEAADELGARPGLRVITFSGDYLRDVLIDDRTTQWLEQVFEQLPKDAAIMDLGRLIWLKFEVGCFYDSYCMVIASKEWESLPEGSFIPDLQLTFKRAA